MGFNICILAEPTAIRCASCNQRFLSAWALMCHLTDFHRMQLYREDEIQDKPDDVSDHKIFFEIIIANSG